MSGLKKIAIETLGCRVNQFDSHQLGELFKKENYAQVSSDEVADVYVVNTCTVTAKADQEAKHLLRRFQRKNPEAIMVLTGCMAQTQGEKLKSIAGVHYIVGNTFKTDLPQIIKNHERSREPIVLVESGFTKDLSFPVIPIHASESKTRVFLKIQDGCNDFCTFCIIPYARGKSRSLAPDHIVEQINLLVTEGVLEVVLTGVSLGSYGVDLEPKSDLAHVVERIEQETDLKRLRMSSLEPEDVDDKLLEVLGASKIFCPHFHLPLQAGDDAILKSMRRNYSKDDYTRLLQKIERTFKDVFIGTDVITGFPGETDLHFKNTFTLLSDLAWSKLHVFPYSPRMGTSAAKFKGQLKRSDILQRADQLRALSEKRYEGYLRNQIGKSVLSLVEKKPVGEGTFKALSRNYLPLTFKSSRNLSGQEIPLSPLSLYQDGLWAQAVGQPSQARV